MLIPYIFFLVFMRIVWIFIPRISLFFMFGVSIRLFQMNYIFTTGLEVFVLCVSIYLYLWIVTLRREAASLKREIIKLNRINTELESFKTVVMKNQDEAEEDIKKIKEDLKEDLKKMKEDLKEKLKKTHK